MPANQKASILVVDDRPEKLLATEALLADMPIEIVFADSGRAALRHLLQRDFAVILLDVDMPVMDGFETASLIRRRKHSEHAPIIFMTACSDEEFMARGYALGAVDYIMQPVVPAVLRAKVSVFVDLYLKSCQITEQSRWQQQRAQQLQKLASASVAINAAPTMMIALQIVTDTARDLIGSHQAITLYREAGGTHPTPGEAHTQAFISYSEKYAAWRGRPLRLDIAAGSVIATSTHATRLTQAQVMAHADYSMIMKLQSQQEIPPVMGLLAAPLMSRDERNMGVIYLSDKAEGDFSVDDEAILTQLSQMAVIAIENHISAEARQANRAKDQFIAVLSHELRTPLTPALVALSEMSSDKRLPGDVRDNLEMVRRNVELEARLIDDLLDLTRISKGKIDLRLATVDVHELLGETLKVCDADAQAKALHIHCDYRAGNPAVRGDRARLQQIFWNLLKNAVKFTPTGGTIEISTENGPDRKLTIRVRDTGIGIDQPALPRIFNAFEQGDRLISRQFGGLGLGLAITKALVESHGGSVGAVSEGRGMGAVFTVTLPSQVAAAGDRHLPLPRLVEAGPPRRLRILLVEDHADTSQVLKRLLTKQLHDVRAVHTVAEALALADKERFELVISDIGLPDGSGLELMPRLRALGLTTGIALSGFGMEEDVARSRAAGFREHLTKPLNFQTLSDCIDRICLELDAPTELSKRTG